jgi:hypothetical protein
MYGADQMIKLVSSEDEVFEVEASVREFIINVVSSEDTRFSRWRRV